MSELKPYKVKIGDLPEEIVNSTDDGDAIKKVADIVNGRRSVKGLPRTRQS